MSSRLAMGLQALRCGVVLVVLAACGKPHPPGERVGAYHIRGELEDNTCGAAAVPAPSLQEFDVDIRRLTDASEEGLWIHGSPPGTPGRLDVGGDFEFISEGTFTPDPGEARGANTLLELDPLALANLDRFEEIERAMSSPSTCVLQIRETARGQITRDNRPAGDAGAASPTAPDLAGKHEIEISASQGDCSSVLVAQGGVFETLPCRAFYTIRGELRATE